MKPLLPCWLAASLLVAAHAEPVTAGAVSKQAASGQAAWNAYLDRSETLAAADAAALRAELEKNGMTVALKAPSGGDLKLSAKPGDAWFSSEAAKELAKLKP